MKHALRWMLALGTRLAGAAVRALAWIEPTHAGESLASLRRTLPRSEWQVLASARATLPGWMAQAIDRPRGRSWPFVQAALTREFLNARLELSGQMNDKLFLHYLALTQVTGYVALVVTLEFGGRARRSRRAPAIPRRSTTEAQEAPERAP